jgi:hypothetical protein
MAGRGVDEGILQLKVSLVCCIMTRKSGGVEGDSKMAGRRIGRGRRASCSRTATHSQTREL